MSQLIKQPLDISTPNNLKFVAIIPARYASVRFPGKPLVDMGGKTMIQRVYEQVSRVIKDVVVATDDQRIFDAVTSFNGKVVMTSASHKSGTDRCYEALTKLSENFDIVLNIQGDEPFIQPEQITSLQACFDDGRADIATLAKVITPADGFGYVSNPNHVKVICNRQQEAMYFSRAVIPYVRNAAQQDWLSQHTFYKHIGVYAYRADVLKEITSLPQSGLEVAESLEQLRWLENGYRIRVGLTEVETIGIDTPEDLESALKLLKN